MTDQSNAVGFLGGVGVALPVGFVAGTTLPRIIGYPIAAVALLAIVTAYAVDGGRRP